MRKALRVLVVAAVAASPAWAGITFTQVTKSVGGRGAGAGDSVTHVWADGGQAKVEWDESNNPIFTKGTYMLVNEKGEMIVVNPEKRTYSKFDLATMMESMNQAMGAAAKMGFKMEVEDPKVEKVLEEPGGEILGYPTTHYRWHTTYTMVFRMIKPMPDRKTASDMTEDVWTTTAIGIPPAAAKAFAGMGQGATMGELRKIMDTAKAKMTGFALKHVTVNAGTGSHGGGQTTTTMEVKEFRKADIPASMFAIPPGYTETDMMQPQKGPAMPNLNQP
jgi:hypothetical protein